MRTTAFILLLFLPLWAASAPIPKGAGKHPWVGKFAFPKTVNTKLYTIVNGVETDTRGSTASSFYIVTKVLDDRVQINYGSEAFFKRDEVLPPAEAIEFYTSAIKAKPKDAFSLACRGWAYFVEHKTTEAEADYTTLVEIEPNNFYHHYRRAQIRMSAKKFEAAIEDLDKLMAQSPNNEWARRTRASANVGLKKFDEAIAEYTKLLDETLDTSAIRIGRGLAYDHSGQHEKALEDYDAVLTANPKSAVAWNNKAWLRSTCPEAKMRNGKEAVEFATKACELTEWANAGYLDTLAAAYAEIGDFDKAVKWQKEAVRDKELLHDEGGEIKERLELYLQKKPYRQKIEKK